MMELLPDVLSFRRLHQTNQSRLLASRSRDEFLNLVKAHLDQRRGLRKIEDPFRVDVRFHRRIADSDSCSVDKFDFVLIECN